MAAGLLVALVVLALYAHFSGHNPLLDAIYDWRLRRLDLEALDRRNLENPRRANVIVTLTTLPSRVDRIGPTIKSLLNQTIGPAAIRLNVPTASRREQRPYEIPAWLRGLKSVTICQCEDFGPATKVIPALLASPPDQCLLVVDDDRIYHRHLVEQMTRHAEARPDAAIAGSGWNAPADLIDRR